VQRDLACHDVWEESLRRSRARREAAAEATGVELPVRKISVVALVALAGGPVVGAAVAKTIGGGDGGAEQAEANPAAVQQATAPQNFEPVAKPAPKPKAETPERDAIHTPARPAPQKAQAAEVVRVFVPPRVETVEELRPDGVSALQAALGLSADGEFGRGTERALKAWQRQNGLAATGVAGAATRQKLGLPAGAALKRPKPVKRRAPAHRRSPGARRARRGGGVRALQAAIGVSADGVFGRGTERALKRWQRRHGLTPDGVVGPQTREELGLGSGPALKRKQRSGRRGGGSSGGGGGNGSSGGGGGGAVQKVIAAANRIASKPYKYGGGHGSFEDSGYDCSGSVSYALHGGGLLGAPLDSSAFMSYGAAGPGKHISIYASPGHVYMTINGRRFDTSARSDSGSRWGGRRNPGSGYVVRHPPGY
jgi:peptidoglycan hydrolase-like protein with peptidoglycan-binding domain